MKNQTNVEMSHYGSFTCESNQVPSYKSTNDSVKNKYTSRMKNWPLKSEV